MESGGESISFSYKGVDYTIDLTAKEAAGFDKATADEDIAVHGGALDDPDFVAGGDRIRYMVRLGNAPGQYRVALELWHQPIGYRWANNLRAHDAPAARPTPPPARTRLPTGAPARLR